MIQRSLIRSNYLGLRPSKLAGLFLFLLTFVIYWVTLAPGVYGFDSAELATGVYTQGIIHPPGYPLYLLIGKVFSFIPIGSLAYRMNIMSAFWGALTITLVYSLMARVLKNRLIAWITAAILGFSNYFWQMSLIAEVYTLDTAFLAFNLLLLVRWNESGQSKYLYLFAFFYGLSLTNRTSGILFSPGFAWLIFTSRHWRWRLWHRIPKMLPVFLLGLTPYIYLSIRTAFNPPLSYVGNYYDIDLATPSGLWWMISGQAYRFFAFGYEYLEIPAEILRFGSFLWRNYMGIGVVIGLIGFTWLFRQHKKFTVGILVIFLSVTVFYVNYRVMDKDTMFLPAYLIWSFFLGAGFLALRNMLAKAASINIPELRAGNIIAGFLSLILIMNLSLNWKWVDMSKATGPAQSAEEILRTAEPNAIIIASWSPAVVLEYYQIVEGKRTDIKIINLSRKNVALYYNYWINGVHSDEIFKLIEQEDIEFINQEISHRTIYSLEYYPAWARQYEYLPEGNYFKLALRSGY